MCITYVEHIIIHVFATHVLHLYFYAGSTTCIMYVVLNMQVIHSYYMCETCVLHVFYMCNTPTYHTCITYVKHM